MDSIVHYHTCPCCGGKNISAVLSVKDYTVSQDTFQVFECADCTVRFTQDISDEANIGKYYQSENYISHSDTNEGIINKLYHYVRSITLRNKYKIICTQTKKTTGSLLDIGAGTGAFANFMKSAKWTVTGLEPDNTARTVAYNKFQLELKSPPELFNFPENSFDAITLWHVLEHVHNLDGYMDIFGKLLKTGGKLFIAVPNYTSYDASFYKEYWAAYDVPRHLYHFSPTSIKLLANKHNLNVTAIKLMWYDSFYISMISEQYKNGKGNLFNAFFVGLISNFKTLSNPEKCSSLIYVMSKK